ncbi:hypothetical protein [Leifsonia sp. NPDC058230]|uniref:hypothetical protein n=1 Tax=Leifsonia sp. NPDC058230 TaxID=3346391 RepID=UPI0036DE3905
MATTSTTTYTAKLTDGPLEGSTVTTEFLDAGVPRPRLELPSSAGSKRYVYIRSSGIEFASDNALDDRPSAVEYRYLEAIFE